MRARWEGKTVIWTDFLIVGGDWEKIGWHWTAEAGVGLHSCVSARVWGSHASSDLSFDSPLQGDRWVFFSYAIWNVILGNWCAFGSKFSCRCSTSRRFARGLASDRRHRSRLALITTSAFSRVAPPLDAPFEACPTRESTSQDTIMLSYRLALDSGSSSNAIGVARLRGPDNAPRSR